MAQAQNLTTTGNCSPSILNNAGSVSINCRINDIPIESVIRNADVDSLIRSMSKGVAAEVILTGFVLGGSNNFAGVDLFERVSLPEARTLVDELSRYTNLNNRIYLNESKFTSLVWLASHAGRADILEYLMSIGLAAHAPEALDDDHWDSPSLRSFFPANNFIRDGGITLQDQTAVAAVLAKSVFLQNDRDYRYEFVESENAFQEKVIARLEAPIDRRPSDWANVGEICRLASISDTFDWCARVKSVPTSLSAPDANDWGNHWPKQLVLVGLLTIRNGYAIFLSRYGERHKSIGMFYAPRRGNEFLITNFQSKYSTGNACWSEILKSFEESCWKTFVLEQDLFEPDIFKGPNSGPIYKASNTIPDRD